ncbi:MAG: DUF4249 domain-containing protein [Prolixibacteraceae bacterium]|nr:DUF4249 domain-containing protein [Prolixibacteraceae bacterium]MBN2773868.1 DUF4249 domain-containing protein [Prolixibacteraceae bacterium]
MKRNLLIILLVLIIASCEEVYVPDLDVAEDCLVIEAIFNAEMNSNVVLLYKSKSFNSTEKYYYPVNSAKVNLVDDTGNNIELEEISEGAYLLDYIIDKQRKYFLSVESDGETYTSKSVSVPETPDIDTVYAEFEDKVTIIGAASNSEDLYTSHGIQLYTDIDKESENNYYRFYGRKIMQYRYSYDTTMGILSLEVPVYCWKSYYPTGIFNIAGPPAYSTEKNISKHELEFFTESYDAFIADTQFFAGWIYIIDQYGVSEEAYNFYKDLNSQLDADGKIFDPVYIQALGNFQCVSDQEKLVLGNFEIESYKQHRYFLKYRRNSDQYILRKINRLTDIPLSGEKDFDPPDFWEI